MNKPTYEKDESGEVWWCNIHNRRASHIFTYIGGKRVHHCDPKLGGIMIPCECVNITDLVEIFAE
jgi:hypothetical protein